MQDAMTGGEGSCPVVHDFRFVGAGEAMTAFGRYDALQDEYRMVRVEEPGGAYYLPLDRDLIVSGMQDTETFSSHALTPLQPNPRYTAIPVMLDPPEHAKWRRLLSGYFGVRQMALLDERIRSVCSELIEAISAMGACDFTEDFAFRFPTTIFLEIFGLPPAELDTFLEWERAILHPGEDGELDRERQFLAAVNLYERLREVIAGRRAAPDPEATDILSDALTWRIDGELVSDEEIVSCCVLLFMAGLDTVANALSFSWRHLATHPDDRAFLAARPTDRGPIAAEELLRAFPIAQIARKVTRETDFGHTAASAPISHGGRWQSRSSSGTRGSLSTSSQSMSPSLGTGEACTVFARCRFAGRRQADRRPLTPREAPHDSRPGPETLVLRDN